MERNGLTAGETLLIVGAVLVSAVGGSVWGGAFLAALVGGQHFEATFSIALEAAVALPSNASNPAQAWPQEVRGSLPGPVSLLDRHCPRVRVHRLDNRGGRPPVPTQGRNGRASSARRRCACTLRLRTRPRSHSSSASPRRVGSSSVGSAVVSLPPRCRTMDGVGEADPAIGEQWRSSGLPARARPPRRSGGSSSGRARRSSRR